MRRLLEQSRLLTLTGVGGAGKTRLALMAADAVLGAYGDGVWLVPLEALTDPALVPRHLATILGIREEPGFPLTETITSYLRPRHILLLLDNCEHLGAACATLAEALLRACTDLRILATSRQPLGIAGEITWRVPSLGLPKPNRRPPVERLRQVESVQLFAERAAAVLPGFAVTEGNAAAVAEVCRRLDGIPLAIELAAARTRVLTVEQIAARLDDRFRLLTGGSPTAPPRQQTLLATLDWSYDALEDQERRLLCRLSVFAGGWTLEAAEVVCAGDGLASSEVLDLLARLVDKSLVVADAAADAAMRYRLLETIRQYGTEKLRSAGAQAAIRQQHAAWYLSLAERLWADTVAPQQAEALERLLAELDNLRAALGWALDGRAITEAGLRACLAAYRLWLVHGFLGEGRAWCAGFAAQVSIAPDDPLRAAGLFAAGTLALFQGDFTGARTLVEDSLALARAGRNGFQIGESLSVVALLALNQGDSTRAWAVIQEDLSLCRERLKRPDLDTQPVGNELARTMYGDAWREVVLGHVLLIAGVGARLRGNYARAVEFYEESLALLRRQGDIWFIAQVLSNLGLVFHDQGDDARARELFQEALAMRRTLGDRSGLARSLNDLGDVAYAEGDVWAAQASYAEELAIVRALGDRSSTADALVALGRVARARDDLHTASSLFTESLAIRQDLGHRLAMPSVLDDLAELAAAEGDAARALRLAGAAAALREAIGSTSSAVPTPGLDAAGKLLGQDASAVSWAEGRAMSEEQMLAYALAPRRSGSVTRPSPARPPDSPLSDRELSVARLLAMGRTNRQIAEELVIAEGTADRHVSNILGKLGLRSRAQVAVWAVDRGLIRRG